MIEPEFPEDHGAYDAAGNYLGESETGPDRQRLCRFCCAETIDDRKCCDGHQGNPERPRRPEAAISFKTFDELSAEPVEKRWLIKNIFARGETSAWIAPPGAMKSALMAQASICVAAGLDWHGSSEQGRGGRSIFALERSDLVHRRLRAHALRQNLKGLPIFVFSAVIDLTNPEAFKKVIDTVREHSDPAQRIGWPNHRRHIREADSGCRRR